MDEYFPVVVQAIPGPDKTIFAYFSDGAICQYDVAPLIRKGTVFEPLEDDQFFRERLTVLNDSAAWDVSGTFDPTTCIDLDPFTVYESLRVSDPLAEVG